MARKNKTEAREQLAAIVGEGVVEAAELLTANPELIQQLKVQPVVEEVKVKKVGVGSTIIDLILNNPELSNQQILDRVKAQFESAQTSYACIAWYKSKLRKEGKIGARVFAKKPVAQPTAE